MAEHDAAQHSGSGYGPRRSRRRVWAAAGLAVVVLGAVVLLVVQLAHSSGGAPRGGAAAPFAPNQDPLPAISVAGDQILRGGQPWWFLGYNSFTWSDDCNGPGENVSTQDLDDWFASMRHDGHGAMRLFFFPGWNVDRLTEAVASAKRNNIYLMITLDNGIEGCGAEEKTAEWFADPDQVAQYRQHLTDLVQRLKGDTTVAWLEYFNEPGWAGGALRPFYDEMGAAAKEIDPDRLFSSGTIATYALDSDENFRNLDESPGVDIVSLHEYDADEVESHWGQGVLANSAGKPVIVGEFGIYASTSGQGDPGDGQTCQATVEQRRQQLQLKADYYTDLDNGYVGALAWAWQPGNSLDRCVTGNLADDQGAQEVLRDTGTG